MTKPILNIENLHVTTQEKPILQRINLQIQPGKVYAVMGPNGAGKSTLAATLVGKPGYTITQGKITYNQQNLLNLTPHQRAQQGIFLAFQQPISIPGITMFNLLKTALNQQQQAKQQPPLTTLQILNLIKEKIKLLNLDNTWLQKPLNQNASGGEKKLNELLQMAVLNPTLAILDELESGLDLDRFELVGKTIQKLKKPNNALIIITHYPKLFQYITPDTIHILHKGKLLKTGDATLADQLLKTGYKGLINPTT